MTTLQTYIDEGRLIRHAWTGTDEDGRATACLLAALAPVCGERKDAAACPAEVMPAWLAHLTPDIDDRGTDEAWPAMVRRYAAVAARWHVLTPEAWQRAEWRFRIACVEEALSHLTVDEWGVRAACEGVIAVLREAIATGTLDAARAADAAWTAARAAADAAGAAARAARAADAAWTAARAAADAAGAAARAAWAGAAAAADAAAARAADAAARAAWAGAAADAAARAAARAADAAARAAWAGAAADAAARAADVAAAVAWDRLTDAVLGILESEVGAC